MPQVLVLENRQEESMQEKSPEPANLLPFAPLTAESRTWDSSHAEGCYCNIAWAGGHSGTL